FEAQDLDAMSELWSHDDDVACTHPGWTTLHGWGSVAASWFALFQQDRPTQFILTDERGRVGGAMGWVTLDENLIDGAAGQTVAALNLFRRLDHSWQMVCHHAGAVAPRRLGAP
ncbi:MAG: nuclear transport factor 2 family protein, partial [Acidimicrobiales bacterium]